MEKDILYYESIILKDSNEVKINTIIKKAVMHKQCITAFFYKNKLKNSGLII